MKAIRGKARTRRWIAVRRAPGRPCQARVQLSHRHAWAAIGRASVRPLKREGDGGTPLGLLPIRQVLYRPDQVLRPRTALPVRAIRPGETWCDDPKDRNYNRLVRLRDASDEAERLMRNDALYDIVLVLGYNDRPRIKNRGSAIFAHLARPGYTPTEGCIALSRRDLLRVLAEASPGTAFVVMR